MVNCLVKSFWHSKFFLPTFQVLPSDIPSSSFRHSKSFPTTGKKFPDNWKKNSRQLEKIFLLFVRKPFKFSKIENFLVERQKKFFLQTGKKFPDNWKKISFRHSESFLPTGKVLPSDRTQTNVRRTTNRVHSKARRTESCSTTTD
ncbi:hypothetical protein TVAG_580730 [Trichomonas vaginalis G3]|uniref:Uncharacterized protein n=1 Tax=Trichomonas vaginalis (strain ATCC PRA-98 / G3) TaxID=412133 RepID=A2HEU4_TRIV3|nr:hypothetical protein TVAGG3_0115030 [Trichomonas vaginalis G3]EAX72072.1 hypothetical protein TVAG_580730 [Trichomonas vaginalis G3]KAI5545115.1 hypothetical protein TVAGG3_0115030 [Trichomonas vaginalis G3]|eukprot:XP_001285002.1 hypothetical protein [Trichomonas vaginalis G3]